MGKLYDIAKRNRKYILMLIDTVIVTVSYMLIFVMNLKKIPNIDYIYMFKSTVFLYVAIYILIFFMFRLYNSLWRYAGISDIFVCIIASFGANLLFAITTALLSLGLTIDIYFLATIFSTFSITLFRIGYRMYRRKSELPQKCNEKDLINLMIIGAGQAALMLINEIVRNKNNSYKICCILDDDRSKIGRKVHNISIVGSTNNIIDIAKEYDIKEIILALPSADEYDKKRILDICSKTNCKLKLMPDLYTLATDDIEKSLMDRIRDVKIEDLLGRTPIKLNCSKTNDFIKDKTVLVTGGGGSIGSELCRQIAVYKPRTLIILDIYENNAYDIEQELKRVYKGSLDIKVEIASVRDAIKLESIFKTKSIDIVFHAAAHKHVPLMETNPEEAVKNNIFGTYNTAVLASRYGVKKFILISTDKAVNPTSFMGATKRITEMLIQSLSRNSRTDFAAVRFGNVLGSNGSVIPLFVKQIKEGGPVTVMHEDITRYFMTIPEAVQLVLQAGGMAHNGDIYILDMGKPVKIKDLAENLIRLSGLEPYKDIQIEFTGLRPGEKLFEELLISQDGEHKKTDIDKIFIEKPYYIDEVALKRDLEQLRLAAEKVDKDALFILMERIVPTYVRTKNDGGAVA